MKQNNNTKKIITLILIIWLAVILFLSGQSGSQAFGLTYRLALPIADVIYQSPDYDQILTVMNAVRFAGRIVAFTIFGMIFTAFIRTVGAKLPVKVRSTLSIAGIVLFGIFDEAHKMLIDGRHCTLFEIIVNIICGLAGAVLTWYIIKRISE